MSDRKNDGVILKDEMPRHGSPQDRGSADAYYGRRSEPHYYIEGSILSDKVEKADMTEDEIAAYYYGYANEDDRKDWG
jgi:hypothetical protein